MLLIDLIFSFINLAILFAIATYVFIHYIKPQIKHEIYTELESIARVKSERINLIERQQDLDKEILEQEKKCKELKLKISLWRDAYQKNQQLLQHDTSEIHAALNNKIAEQSQNYHMTKVKNRVSKKVYDTLEHTLESHFENEESAKSYFAALFKKVKSEA